MLTMPLTLAIEVNSFMIPLPLIGQIKAKPLDNRYSPECDKTEAENACDPSVHFHAFQCIQL